MHRQGVRSPASGQPKSLARSCTYCRIRKIRCDAAKPSCATCTQQRRDCSYHIQEPRKRPTLAQINELREEKAALQSFILRLKHASHEERDDLLSSISGPNIFDQLPFSQDSGAITTLDGSQETNQNDLLSHLRTERNGDLDASSDEDLDVAPFMSVDEVGRANNFGPSSALHLPPKPELVSSLSTQNARPVATEYIKNSLIANAALQRQREHELSTRPYIDGVPTELALHLLDLHWNRQHHTMLLTYRPAVMRDLLDNGPNCSLFLINALWACSSKFSQRLEVRDDPAVPATCGQRFFRRCDELLVQDSLLTRPAVPTVAGMLLLGSTYNARGETSKGWLYTGYALRMVYDLGLHIDRGASPDANPEEIEIKRRVFWGAFICDKMQSLYLGRPVMINLRDAHVSRNLMDTFEEKELWTPYIDPKTNSPQPSVRSPPTPIHSVSTFQQFCSLSKIMTRIITKLYVVGATSANASTSLHQVDTALQQWNENLPMELRYEPWLPTSDPNYFPPPTCMTLHCIYHALIILLHRPFISDGHLRLSTTPAISWRRCTTAAQCITSIALAYQTANTLLSAPYILSYAIYVACTIHVRNATAEGSHAREQLSLLLSSLRCLEELSSANPGVSKPANIIRKLMAANKLDLNIGKYQRPKIKPHSNHPVEEDKPTPQSTASLDLNTIYSTFPSRGTTQQYGTNGMDFDDRTNLDFDFFTDPLYGLMDQTTLPYADMNDFYLGMGAEDGNKD